MATYFALMHKEPASDFGVSFPDFPGCVTAGATPDEAANMAAEALALHIEGMVEDGDTIPEPATFDLIRDSEDAKGAAILAVTVPDQPSKVVRLNITLQERVLERIDKAAARRGLTRSGFIAVAANRLAGEPF